MTSLDVSVVSTKRLFPTYTQESSNAHQVPLSILDASVASYAVTGGVWLYNTPSSAAGLVDALQRTVDVFSPWAGQLTIMKTAEEYDRQAHTRRYGSVWLAYGTKDVDVGVEVIEAKHVQKLSSLVAAKVQGGKFTKVLSGQSIPGVFPTPPVALYDSQNHPGLPGLIVQITTFACGGFALGVKLAHVLGDAQTLITFMRAWAAAAANVEVTPPVFAPHMIDAAAPGELAGLQKKQDNNLVQIARTLPMNRFDWWSSKEGCPSWGLAQTQIPEFVASDDWEAGESIPWADLDASIPVDHYRLHFTAEDVERVYKMCTAGAQSTPETRISKLDCLNAFLWLTILRARREDFAEHGDEIASFNMTLGVRERLAQPLGSNFLGSPIIQSRASTSVREVSSLSVRELALEIRRTISQFGPSAVQAVLHEMAHDPCPQRIWATFLGRRNTMVTSWLRLGVYDLDFGSGKPSHVEAIMPSIDGLVHLMEVGETPEAGLTRNWYGNGVIASVYLRRDVGERLTKEDLFSNIV